MTINVDTILLAIAIASFAFAAFGVKAFYRWQFGWGGVLLAAISLFVSVNF